MIELINNESNFHQAFSELKSKNYKLEKNGQPILLRGIMGEGGSKTVYDATVEENPIALALPNTVDNTIVAERKWNNVLKEPENTAKIRDMGLLTNPICEQMGISINSIPIQAVKMMRYQDIPFEVRDAKNRKSSIIKTNLIPENGINEEDLRILFDGIANDIETLVANGVLIGSDSMNIAVDKGHVRLYLNDLGSAKIRVITDDEIQGICESYARSAISSLINSLTEKEYRSAKDDLDTIAYSEEGFQAEMVDRIISNVRNKSSQV